MPIYVNVGCLCSVVALRDVDDVEAYVAGAVRKTFPRLPACEREELEAEGLLILWDLDAKWNGGGTFRGFASSRLGFRLIDARRRLNRGSRAAAGPFVLSLDRERERPSFDEGHVRLMVDFARVPAVA